MENLLKSKFLLGAILATGPLFTAACLKSWPILADSFVLRTAGIGSGMIETQPNIGPIKHHDPCDHKTSETVSTNMIEATIQPLLIHQLRLEAELQGTLFEPPNGLQVADSIEPIGRAFYEETIIFNMRKKSLVSQFDGLRRSAVLLRHEFDINTAKDKIAQQQIILLQEQLGNVSQLVKRGTLVVSEKMTLEQTLAQQQLAELDLQITILRTQEEQLKAEQGATRIVDARKDENLIDLSQTQTKIASLRQQLSEEGTTLLALVGTAPLQARGGCHGQSAFPQLATGNSYPSDVDRLVAAWFFS